LHTPKPSYSDEARKWQFKGMTVLIIVVDSGGTVPRVQIARPIGMGLDARAAEMVRTWKFEPATKDGIPVAVLMTVEVNFELF
jgi:protein TonB